MALLDDAAKKSLLQRARHAIAKAIGVTPPPPKATADLAEELGAKAGVITDLSELRAGAFVTLRIRGNLRGCIGYPEPQLLLVDVVDRCAVSAALADPRFPPLSPDEWNDIDLELSILGPIESVGDIGELVIGRDGLIVEFGRRRGLLLPQVAVEWKWDVQEFASQTCIKAGLPRDAWQKGAKLFRFEAEVFGEET